MLFSTLQLMNESAKRYLGEHDFRNFCKVQRSLITSSQTLNVLAPFQMDITGGVTNFVRTITSFEVATLTEG